MLFLLALLLTASYYYDNDVSCFTYIMHFSCLMNLLRICIFFLDSIMWKPIYLNFLQDGCIVCPTTDSTFYLQNGAIKEWYPNNPVLRVLTPALRNLFVYPVKTDNENIYISMRGGKVDASAEIVFSGKAQPGVTATDVNVDEVIELTKCCLVTNSSYRVNRALGSDSPYMYLGKNGYRRGSGGFWVHWKE